MCEFLWRFEIKGDGTDPFLQIIEDIKYVYPAD